MSNVDDELSQLLARNQQWANGVRAATPSFFSELSQLQTPRYLWIGCSDSRVPANQILGLAPGEIFVHRNVANIVVHTDLNCLSVIQYAVDVLKVGHIIVCGHYGCGGVQAALRNQKLGLIDNWLRHIQDIRDRNGTELAAMADIETRVTRLCELNVVAQMGNVAQTTIVQDAWARGQEVSVHGLVYGLMDGILRKIAPSLSAAHPERNGRFLAERA
jgi:carbonic anhydrase